MSIGIFDITIFPLRAFLDVRAHVFVHAVHPFDNHLEAAGDDRKDLARLPPGVITDQHLYHISGA